MNIITLNHQNSAVLMTASAPCVIPPSPEVLSIIEQMDQTLNEVGDHGFGLAACQIGHNIRVFIMRDGDENKAFINPVILEQSAKCSNLPEGCLSIPGAVFRIKRPKSVKLQYYNIDAELCTETFSGFQAKAICHEMGHLEGKLITELFSKDISNQAQRSSFGMKLTSEKISEIKQRRLKNKRAKKARVLNRKS